LAESLSCNKHFLEELCDGTRVFSDDLAAKTMVFELPALPTSWLASGGRLLTRRPLATSTTQLSLRKQNSTFSRAPLALALALQILLQQGILEIAAATTHVAATRHRGGAEIGKASKQAQLQGGMEEVLVREPFLAVAWGVK
jgi:hypothetical protein